ncbi:MAG: 5-(carboxyamino)imidazole ribonucleotide synthase [Steroidobacteraceae bacterium]
MKVGIVGGGQLARMLALAAHPLGVGTIVQDPDATGPAAQVTQSLRGAFTDRAALRRLGSASAVITFDWENIAVGALRQLGPGHRFAPPLRALEIGQDRLREKNLFRRLKVPTTHCRAVADERGLRAAVREIGLPGVLKTRRLGYDGKGQVVLRRAQDIAAAWQQVAGAPCIYEELIHYEYEVSALAVRGRDGQVLFYPLTLNWHEQGILRLSRAPLTNAALQHAAERHVSAILESLDYVGVMAVEFFVRDGGLVANEIAPRVHNSGHWTIEGAATSQFENHLRAICALPLGATTTHRHVAMVNLIGRMPAQAPLLAIEDLHWHDYGKTARPGRKLGHLTVLADSARKRDRLARKVLSLVMPRPPRSLPGPKFT